MELSETLLKAYRETHYHVYTEQPFFIVPESFSPELLKLHEQYDCQSSAFITAWNPLSKQASDEVNTERNKELRRVISDSGCDSIAGSGQHPSDSWPGEESFLVLGIQYEAACSIAKRFNQHAILYSNKDAIPKLVALC